MPVVVVFPTANGGGVSQSDYLSLRAKGESKADRSYIESILDALPTKFFPQLTGKTIKSHGNHDGFTGGWNYDLYESEERRAMKLLKIEIRCGRYRLESSGITARRQNF